MAATVLKIPFSELKYIDKVENLENSRDHAKCPWKFSFELETR